MSTDDRSDAAPVGRGRRMTRTPAKLQDVGESWAAAGFGVSHLLGTSDDGRMSRQPMRLATVSASDRDAGDAQQPQDPGLPSPTTGLLQAKLAGIMNDPRFHDDAGSGEAGDVGGDSSDSSSGAAPNKGDDDEFALPGAAGFTASTVRGGPGQGKGSAAHAAAVALRAAAAAERSTASSPGARSSADDTDAESTTRSGGGAGNDSGRSERKLSALQASADKAMGQKEYNAPDIDADDSSSVAEQQMQQAVLNKSDIDDWVKANGVLYDVLYLRTKGVAASLVKKHKPQPRARGDGYRVWSDLIDKFQPDDQEYRRELIAELNSISMKEGTDPDIFLAEVQDLANKLEYLGEGVSEARLADIVLQGLPPSYDQLRLMADMDSGFTFAKIERTARNMYKSHSRGRQQQRHGHQRDTHVRDSAGGKDEFSIMVDSGASAHFVDSDLIPDLRDCLESYQELQPPMIITTAGMRRVYGTATGVLPCVVVDTDGLERQVSGSN
eukprot:g2268.t1